MYQNAINPGKLTPTVQNHGLIKYVHYYDSFFLERIPLLKNMNSNHKPHVVSYSYFLYLSSSC